MSASLPEESAEDLYENAPCGYLSTTLDGTIIRVNRTFEDWTGLQRKDLLGRRSFQDLLTAGGRIYHETHYSPLLRMQGSVRAIAVEIVRADGSHLPALINSVLATDEADEAETIRTAVFDASDRRRYEQELLRARRDEHELAVQLQRGLLARELPSFDGVEIGVAYRPGRSGTEVGGDWYDAFGSDDEGERVSLVVGDVVGRGIDAATDMGQLRSAVRAFAAADMGPDGLLGALDRYSLRYGVGRMATLVVAELERSSQRLRYACAGHLPPVLSEAGRPPRFLWGGRSLPLAIDATLERPEEEVGMSPGSTLILYTDGLVERRGRGIDASLERLLAEVEALSSKGPEEIAHGLAAALHESDNLDDVCILAARVTGKR